jgi:hypothetical protein
MVRIPININGPQNNTNTSHGANLQASKITQATTETLVPRSIAIPISGSRMFKISELSLFFFCE